MGALRTSGPSGRPVQSRAGLHRSRYHAIATDMPGRNLDPVLVGDDLIGPLYLHGSRGADIAVVEGVMGLFDGRIDEADRHAGAGSTAQVAKLLSRARSCWWWMHEANRRASALVQGFATFDHGVRLGGGDPQSGRVDATRTRAEAGVRGRRGPGAGSPSRFDELMVPSRHLGLVTATEHGRRAIDAVEAMATLIGRHVDLAAVVEMADCGIRDQPWSPESRRGVGRQSSGSGCSRRCGIHVRLCRALRTPARGRSAGGRIRPAGRCAAGADGGGGSAGRVSRAAPTAVVRQRHVDRADPRASAVDSDPCGMRWSGLSHAGELDGHPLCGAIARSARFTERLTLGYRDAAAVSDSALYAAGERVVGHEFHRTEVRFSGGREAAWAFRRDGGPPVRDGVIRGESTRRISIPIRCPSGCDRAVCRQGGVGRSGTL